VLLYYGLLGNRFHEMRRQHFNSVYEVKSGLRNYVDVLLRK
jgi:hypothetical protein